MTKTRIGRDQSEDGSKQRRPLPPYHAVSAIGAAKEMKGCVSRYDRSSTPATAAAAVATIATT